MNKQKFYKICEGVFLTVWTVICGLVVWHIFRPDLMALKIVAVIFAVSVFGVGAKEIKEAAERPFREDKKESKNNG